MSMRFKKRSVRFEFSLQYYLTHNGYNSHHYEHIHNKQDEHNSYLYISQLVVLCLAKQHWLNCSMVMFISCIDIPSGNIPVPMNCGTGSNLYWNSSCSCTRPDSCPVI